MIADQRNP